MMLSEVDREIAALLHRQRLGLRVKVVVRKPFMAAPHLLVEIGDTVQLPLSVALSADRQGLAEIVGE
jgi:hypothetical protein